MRTRIVLGEAVIPRSSAKLAWVSAKPNAVAVTFEPSSGVALEDPPLSAELPCDALALDPTSVDMRAAVPGLKPGKRGLLGMRRVIPPSITPGGAPVANLTAQPGADAEITLLELSGQHARILWERSEALVFGWVPTSGLQTATGPRSLRGYGTGSGSGFGRSVHPRTTVVCPDDVPLVAEAEGERLTVGRVLAGVTINVMDKGEEERVVVVPSGIFWVPSEVKLLVRAARLNGCTKAP